VPSTETKAEAEVAIRIAAKPETVFDFFTDPEKMIQWMGRSAELEPSPGGRFHVDINGESIASGVYVELDPPRKVVFTWGWEGEDSVTLPGSSTVEILLAADGDGTRLRLIHRDLPDAESAERHSHGWEHYAERLSVAASGGNPGPDPWATPEGVADNSK
jgi:uncharacterized protein YndB with AHSA1/START domain